MNKKQFLINKVKNFEEKYFNEDQKIIAIDILKNAPEEQVQAYADFIFMKRRTGFAFDYSPEIAKGRLITLYEDKKRRINIDDEIKDDENKLIIGDNYNALKALLITHKNKIDIIYIDPPYNTEAAKQDGNQSFKNGQASKFVYKDKFGRGGWLNMMKARLNLAKDLLTNDGVIFVSIDDTEQAYLKVLMDDIFGESNFVKTLIFQTNSNVMKGSKDFRKDHEYIIVYSKKIYFSNFKKLKNNKIIFKNPDNDPKGDWISTNATYKLNKKSKNYFSINDPQKKYTFLRTWRFTENEYKQGKVNLYFQKSNIPRKKVYKKNYDFEKQNLSTIIKLNFSSKLPYSKEWMHNFSHAKKEIYSILNHNLFSTPKPVKLIKWLIDRNFKKNLIVLDFFAGSGTTGHAVIELNKEDGGNRRFILCTNNENKIAHSVTYERLHRIIKGIGTKRREKDFLWLKKNKPFLDQKLRVINIDDSVKISLNENISDQIYDNCLAGLKLLDKNYKKTGINLYYDLAALNPLTNDEDKFKS